MRLGFDPREYANRDKKNGSRGTKYKPAPEGFYDLECIEVTPAVSKAGNKMLKVEFEILDPPTADTGHVWHYFVLEHDDSEYLKSARADLAKWFVAAGKPDAQDSSELEHTRCRVKLAIEPGKGDYGPSNKIKFFAEPKGKPKSAKPKPESKPESKPEAKPESEHAAEDELEDDIPFK